MTPNIITKRPTNLLKYMTPKIIIITKPPKVCTYLLSRYIWNISIKKRNKDNTKSRIYKCFGLHSNVKNMEYTNLVMVSLTLANKKTVLFDILWEVKIFRNYQGPRWRVGQVGHGPPTFWKLLNKGPFKIFFKKHIQCWPTHFQNAAKGPGNYYLLLVLH